MRKPAFHQRSRGRRRAGGVLAAFLLLAGLLTLSPQAAIAGTSHPPITNGYPVVTPMTLTPVCVAGVPTSLTVQFSWDATMPV